MFVITDLDPEPVLLVGYPWHAIFRVLHPPLTREVAFFSPERIAVCGQGGVQAVREVNWLLHPLMMGV